MNVDAYIRMLRGIMMTPLGGFHQNLEKKETKSEKNNGKMKKMSIQSQHSSELVCPYQRRIVLNCFCDVRTYVQQLQKVHIKLSGFFVVLLQLSPRLRTSTKKNFRPPSPRDVVLQMEN